jgi:hypothetical protein
MGDYICPKCNVTFNKKNHLNYHVEHDACKETNYICKYCDNGFTKSNSMYRHMKYNCKVKKREDIEKQATFEILKKLAEKENEEKREIKNLKEENKQLREDFEQFKNDIKVKTLKANNKTINNNVLTSNINNGIVNNNINNNFILVGYGREDLSRLSKAELLNAIQAGYRSTVTLSKTVHFNPKYPEYQNIYISNMKDTYAMMFDGNKWTLTTKEDLIDTIYEDKKNYIEENLEEFVGSLPPSGKRALDNWLAIDDDNENVKVKNIKNEIKLLLYNEKNIGINSKAVYEANAKSIKATTSLDKTNTLTKSKSKSIKSVKNVKKNYANSDSDNDSDNVSEQSIDNTNLVKITKKPVIKKIAAKPPVKVRKSSNI